MKQDKSVFANSLLAFGVFAFLLLAAALFSGCETSHEYSSVCGDGICTSSEMQDCAVDCPISQGPDPDKDIVSETTINESKSIREILDAMRREKNNTLENGVDGTGIGDYGSDSNLADENKIVAADTKIFSSSYTAYIPMKGLRVASAYNLLSLNENISDFRLILTKYQLREILRSGRLSSNSKSFGPRAAYYEQFLRFGAGRVVFGLEEESGVVTSYLKFKEGEPMLDYLFEMRGGIFKFFEPQKVLGEKETLPGVIHFLGHDYYIMEVQEEYLTLKGVSTPDTITFRDGHGAIINGVQYTNNKLNVSLRNDSLRVIILADRDFNILPGESLMTYLKNPETLLTNRIDLAYNGLTDAPVENVLFELSGSKYRLVFKTNEGIKYDIGLQSLLTKEGVSSNDYYVKKGDSFVISNARENNGLIHIIKLVGVEDEDNLVTLEDSALETFRIYFSGTPGVNASGNLLIDGVNHRVYVGKNDTVSVDLDGNGRIGGDSPPIIVSGNMLIRLVRLENGSINASIVTPRAYRENANSDLVVRLMLTSTGMRIPKDDLQMELVAKDDSLIGLSDYGAIFLLSKKTDLATQRGEDLLIQYPLVQRFADVMIRAYE